MKLKILFSLFALLMLAPLAHAEDCMHDPIYERDWNAVITTGARVRNIPCMETSTVLGTVPVGQVVHVIAETDGYYKIETATGIQGWSGQWLMTATDKPFNIQSAEPATQPTTTYACDPSDFFSDICGYNYETAVRYLFERQIVGGYPDGSFRPKALVNRAEFVKIITASVLQYNPDSDPLGADAFSLTGLEFSDVQSGAWYIPYLRKAVQSGLISGYPDGTFKPSRTINLTEAAKILSIAYKLALGATASPWYAPYVAALQNQSVIPTTLKTLGQAVARGEMAEMIWRIQEKVQSSPSTQFDL